MQTSWLLNPWQVDLCPITSWDEHVLTTKLDRTICKILPFVGTGEISKILKPHEYLEHEGVEFGTNPWNETTNASYD